MPLLLASAAEEPLSAGAAVAFEPHSALRKSFHFRPFAVPLACAALYLALHSFIVRDCADGMGIAQVAIATAATVNAIVRVAMISSPLQDERQFKSRLATKFRRA